MLSSTSSSLSSSSVSSSSSSDSSETSEWNNEEIAEERRKKVFEKVLSKSDNDISDNDISDVFKDESEECPYDIKCELPNMLVVKVTKPPINKKLPMNAIKKYMVSFVNFVRMTSDVYISDKMFKENLERLKKEFNEMLEIVNK